MLSSYRAGKCSMRPSAALKPITSRCSPGGIVQRRDQSTGPAGMAVVVALTLLRAYKLVLSPLFAGSCRFEPSCSNYMAESIQLYGLRAGVLLGVKRLWRCRPFGGHGFDPVPRPHR
jgi:putative membrane protein insertion efficiency factor